MPLERRNKNGTRKESVCFMTMPRLARCRRRHTSLGYEILRRPPCSPDLTPSDVLLFPRMKTSLHGKHFKESIAQVERSLITQNKEIMASGSLSIDGKVCNWLANM